jgi:hypothetical protein
MSSTKNTRKKQLPEKMLANYQDMVHLISSGGSLQDLTDLACRYLDNPITIIDSSYKILAISYPAAEKIVEPEDTSFFGRAYKHSVDSRQMNKESLSFIKDSGRFQACATSHQPHLVSKDSLKKNGMDSPCSFIDCSVWINHVFAAAFSVGDLHRPFSDTDMTYCQLILDLFSIVLQKDASFVDQHGMLYEALMRDLIEGKNTDDFQIKLRLNILDRKLEDDLYIIVARQEHTSMKDAQPPVIEQNILRQFFPGCLSMIYHNSIVLLTSAARDGILGILQDEDFLTLLKTNNTKIGVSQVFHSPSAAKKYFQQAETAFSLGSSIYKDRYVYTYNMMAFYNLLQEASHAMNLQDLCHPVLQEMMMSESDYQHELLNTLYAWIIYDRDSEKIIEKLHISRSSLFHRINRVKELLGKDLDNGETIFELTLSFKLIEYYMHFINPDSFKWFNAQI